MSMPQRHVSQLTSVALATAEVHTATHPVERPLNCEEAGELLRVHPRTIKRMAGRGELPGHFRFGRWFFYPSELDSWMRMELDSGRHP
jgi:excisionase family DNA binding protein